MQNDKKEKNLPTKAVIKLIILLSAAFMLVFAVGVADNNFNPLIFSKSAGNIAVHFIDVGQGDAALIVTANDNSVLIDCGNGESKSYLCTYIKGQGIDTIDYLILSHPHSDHIGGLDAVFESFDVKNVIIGNDFTDVKLDYYIEREGIITTVCCGDTFFMDDIDFTIVAPVNENYSDSNDASLVIKAEFGNTSFLFTGDCTEESEKDIVNYYNADFLKCNVLKAGHHGAVTSNSEVFLDAVCPDIAVISVGADNSYGHPDYIILERMKKRNIKYYRTDTDGNIIIESDGDNISVYH